MLSKHLKISLGFFIAGVILLAGALVFIFWGADQIIRSIIKGTVVLEEGSEVWERFEEVPFPFHFKVNFFNIENPSEALQGEKPMLAEKGPYYFNLSRSKTISETGSVIGYRETLNFEYDQDLSGGRSLDEVVTVVNPAMIGLLVALEDIDLSLPVDLEAGMKSVFDEPYIFLVSTVRELAFEGTIFCNPNKTDSIGKVFCLLFMLLEPKNMEFNEDLSISFSYFGYKNATDDGTYRINSGIEDISQLGSIITWNNMSYSSFWDGNYSACNRIEGSRSSVFPPFLTKTTDFDVFSTDICKSAHIIYKSESSFRGIEGYRFGTYLNSFTSSDDGCYCTGSRDIYGNDVCYSNGLLDLYNCVGAPVILSFPHFLWLQENYIDTVDGLNASEEKHSTYVDINPYLGIPLQTAQKIQFNLGFRPYYFGNGTVVDFTSNMSRALIPMIWVDEGMELPTDITDQIKSELYNRLLLIEILEWTVIGLSAAMIIASTSYYVIYKTVIKPRCQTKK